LSACAVRCARVKSTLAACNRYGRRPRKGVDVHLAREPLGATGSGRGGASCDRLSVLLAVDHALVGFGVAGSAGVDLRVLDLAQVLRGELDVRRSEVLSSRCSLVVPGMGTIQDF